MRKHSQVGLIAEGNSTNSAVLRLPTIAEELGPVKSGVFRVARRLSNFLHAGYAVSEYKELNVARVVLVRAPDPAIPRIVAELCVSDMIFKKLSFVLCESWLTSDALAPLRERGALVATMVPLPSGGRSWFAVEGQTAAVRQVRRILQRNEVGVLELRPGTKPLYFAAELLTTAIPLPLFLTAQQALRMCGISGPHLRTALEEMAREMFKDVLKGERLSWTRALNECSPTTANQYFEVLRHNHPALAEILDEQLAWAFRRMSRAQTRTRKAPRRLPNGWVARGAGTS
jgi:hypothetical protein